MKLARAIHFDESDQRVFHSPARTGEWCIAGGFEFSNWTDADLTGKARQAFSNGWLGLETFGREIAARSGTVIGGCSSLKRAYRDHITQAAGEPVLFIYLNGTRELIAERMGKRQGHFMPTSLLDSQFATLEVPAEDECAIDVDIDAPTDEIVRRILAKLGA